jgi:hypothetical protein
MSRHVGLVILFFLVVLFASQDVFPAATPIESLVPKTAQDGWALRDTPETFTRETLFEHIDGQADLFLQYGFEKSVLAIYRNANSSEDKIDVDIYDMGNSLQAFGVFSRFRQDESPAGIGLDSYLADNYALFYKGKHFVVLQATDANPSTLKGLAKDIESRILDKSPPPKEIGYFPKSGLKLGSIEYFPDGLLGHQFLKRGFKASYEENDKTTADAKTTAEDRNSCLFLSIFENPQEARCTAPNNFVFQALRRSMRWTLASSRQRTMRNRSNTRVIGQTEALPPLRLHENFILFLLHIKSHPGTCYA